MKIHEEALRNDTDVLSHIRNQNAEMARQAKAAGSRRYFTFAEELAPRFATVYDFEFTMALDTYSDMYKETHGFRPRFDWDSLTLQDVLDRIENLG